MGVPCRIGSGAKPVCSSLAWHGAFTNSLSDGPIAWRVHTADALVDASLCLLGADRFGWDPASLLMYPVRSTHTCAWVCDLLVHHHMWPHVCCHLMYASLAGHDAPSLVRIPCSCA